jgi:hypothetical protein
MPLPSDFNLQSFRDSIHALHWEVCSCFFDCAKGGVLQFHWQIGGWESDYGSEDGFRLSFTVMPSEDLDRAALVIPGGRNSLSPTIIAQLTDAVAAFGMSVHRSVVEDVEVGDGAFQRPAVRIRVEFGVAPLPHEKSSDPDSIPF